MTDQPKTEEGPGVEEPGDRERIASYQIRAHLYRLEGTNVVPVTVEEMEAILSTQLGYTYGEGNVSVSVERLDK